MPAGATTAFEGKSYDNVDDTNKIPDFLPSLNLGNHVPVQQTYTTFTTVS